MVSPRAGERRRSHVGTIDGTGRSGDPRGGVNGMQEANAPAVPDETPPLRVLRVYHSAVVTGWRQRDRELRRLGCDVRLVSPLHWNEGGREVVLDAGSDEF